MAKFSYPPLSAGPPSRRNWYKELLDDPECQGNPTRVQEAYETHREIWREKQIELCSNMETNPVAPDQALIKHLARQKRLRNGHVADNDNTDAQEVNCCVVWARPPPIVLETIRSIQIDLARLLRDDIHLIPRKDLHLSVIELSHRHSVPHLRNVVDEIGESGIQDILDLISKVSPKPELLAPTISFDKMGIALNYLPSSNNAYTYHHLRSDMHAVALDSGIKGIDMCYTAPSAHITIGKFIGNEFFETSEARKKFVKLVTDFNLTKRGNEDAWVVGDGQGLEIQLGYLKFGRESSKAHLIGKV